MEYRSTIMFLKLKRNHQNETSWVGGGATGIVDRSMVPKFKTFNKHLNLQVLLHLHDSVHYKQPSNWKQDKRKSHHDNSTGHSAQNFF
jgi:hypothetical protein